MLRGQYGIFLKGRCEDLVKHLVERIKMCIKTYLEDRKAQKDQNKTRPSCSNKAAGTCFTTYHMALIRGVKYTSV